MNNFQMHIWQQKLEALTVMARCSNEAQFLTERAAAVLTGVMANGVEVALTADDIRAMGWTSGKRLVELARDLGYMPTECCPAIREGYSRDAVTIVWCDGHVTTFHADDITRCELVDHGPQLAKLQALYENSTDVDEIFHLAPQEAQFLFNYVVPILTG